MPAYYNEFDPHAAAWLRELIRADLIPDGWVDTRDIRHVEAEEVAAYNQVHLFAGIGGWPLALQLAGWPADRPVWTGSCPCQPFSSAGRGKKADDPRHLWPEMFRLVRQCRPPVVFGEQVASRDGRGWFAGVRLDLEGVGYAVGAADLCAAGAGEVAEGRVRRGDSYSWEPVVVGAPHIRQRLFFVGHPEAAGRDERAEPASDPGPEAGGRGRGIRTGGPGPTGHLGDRHRAGPLPGEPAASAARHGRAALADGPVGVMGDANCSGPQDDQPPGPEEGRDVERPSPARPVEHADGVQRPWQRRPGPRRRAEEVRADQPGGLDRWSAFDILPCTDGKARRVESGSFPLVARLPAGVVPGGDPGLAEVQATAEARVTRLRGYGNSIVPPLAAAFVTAYLEARPS